MKIDKLLLMEIKELNNYILEDCSREEKIKILKDKRIKEKYLDFGSYNYALFAFLLIGLKTDIKYMLDKEFLNIIFSGETDVEDKLRSVMVCYPEFINEYSSDARIIETIVNSEYLIRHVNKFDSRFGQKFLDYIFNHDMINKFLLLNESVQTELLNDKNNLDEIKKCNISDLFISYLSKDSIEILMKDNYFVNRIINMKIDVIDNIVNKGISIPNDTGIINKYVNINDINLYRAYVENLNKANSNLVEIVENKRKKEYDSIFNNVSTDGLLNEYQKIYYAIVNGDEIDAKYVDLVMGFYGNYENI